MPCWHWDLRSWRRVFPELDFEADVPASGAELWGTGDEAGPRTEGSKLGNWKPQPLLESQGFGVMLTGTGANREVWVCFQPLSGTH